MILGIIAFYLLDSPFILLLPLISWKLFSSSDASKLGLLKKNLQNFSLAIDLGSRASSLGEIFFFLEILGTRVCNFSGHEETNIMSVGASDNPETWVMERKK